jgi:hypothetical protein
MANRFPGHLKNYAASSKKRVQKIRPTVLRGKGKAILISSSTTPNFTGYDAVIMRIVEGLSASGRGQLRKQIENLIAAANTKKKGPLYFSGGILAYIFYREILFTREKIAFEVLTLKSFSYDSFCKFLANGQGHLLVGSPLEITICPSLRGHSSKQIMWLSYSSKLLHYWGLSKNRKKNFLLYIFKVSWANAGSNASIVWP